VPSDRRAIVVVPTYDERESLPLFVERFAPTGLDLLIVDDSSPDGTGELAAQLAAQRPWMHVLHRADKDGLGMAYRAGFAWCLQRGYGVIGQMDCDLSHPPEKLAEMQRALHERDAGLVLGSRYAPGGGTAGWSRTRLALSPPAAAPRGWRSVCRSRTSAAASSCGAPTASRRSTWTSC
jgi:dolichol-phosphate mannosyltransferase